MLEASVKKHTFAVDTVVEKYSKKQDTAGNAVLVSREIYPAGTTMNLYDEARYSYKFYTLTELTGANKPTFN